MCSLGSQSIIKFIFVQKMPQLVPDIGKHRAKWKLETVPPWKLETVPPFGGGGAKSDPQSGTENNSPVVQFLTFLLLLAAVKIIFSKKRWYSF